MVFLYSQTKHPLIPEVLSPEADLALATETKNFRSEFFRLLQTKIQELSANYGDTDDSEAIYRHIRQELDATPEIQLAHQRRAILQDRLWERVVIEIDRDIDRLESLLKPGGIMIHLESQLFLDPPHLVARYFRDTEVWVNSEPYLGYSKLEDLKNYVKLAGFEVKNFSINFVPGYFALKKGNDRASWIALCTKKD
jgi:hypothetical protein